MIKSYLKIAFRNLVKSRVYSLINISGLAIGLASFIIILVYLNYELSYDKWDSSLNRVYKISEQSDEEVLERTSLLLPGLLKQKSPVIEAATAIQPNGNYEILLSAGEKKIYQPNSISADSLFFTVFPYKMFTGSTAGILNKPNAMVLDKETAVKLFGSTDVIGKSVKLFNVFDFEITGVMLQPGKPSHLDATVIYRNPYEKGSLFWGNYSFLTYIKTKQAVPVEKLEGIVNGIYYNERLKKDNLSLADFKSAGHQAGLFADAVQNLHNFPKHGSSNFKTVSILLLLAVLLLLAGAINFSNLSIAASVRRAKEIGVRKVLGSGRRQLVAQFMGEIALQCTISLLIAVFLVNMILPYFNREFNLHLTVFQSGNEWLLYTQITLCLLLVIFLSGLYPSLFLSGYNINKVLKGDYSRGTGGAAFRNALVVVQFAVSAFFIIATLVISSQMNYMQRKDKGFSGDQVMRINAKQDTREKNFDLTKTLLEKIPGVQYVSKTTTVPGDAINDTSTYAFKHDAREYRMSSVKVSTDYFKTLNIKLLEGRTFDNSYADQNTRNVVINKAAAAKLNIKNPLGAIISFPYCDTVPMHIVGVVSDFNVSGFENNLQPVVFSINNNACMFQSGGALLVKFGSNHIQQSVAALEKTWKAIEPDFPVRYSFLDENFQKLFASYARIQKIINFFGIIAILISAMGLFALTAFLIGQRTKEIGIRKILGAKPADLGLLLSKDFIRLVLIAVIIAVPVGWWAANEWLNSFAYRINLPWWMFIVAGLLLLTVALLTVSIQTIKAATANPVKAIRTE